MKKCVRCKKLKHLTEFRKNNRSADGYQYRCNECDSKRMKDRYAKNPEKYRLIRRESWKKEYSKNPERFRKHSHDFYHANKNRLRERLRIIQKNSRLKLRADVLTGYGGRCKCCGIGEIKFLSIDHVNGGGNRQRKAGIKIYSWLRNNNYPLGFQVLCHNCNLAKGFYGECPHKRQ